MTPMVPPAEAQLIMEPGVDLGDPWAGVDAVGLERAVRDQAGGRCPA